MHSTKLIVLAAGGLPEVFALEELARIPVKGEQLLFKGKLYEVLRTIEPLGYQSAEGEVLALMEAVVDHGHKGVDLSSAIQILLPGGIAAGSECATAGDGNVPRCDHYLVVLLEPVKILGKRSQPRLQQLAVEPRKEKKGRERKPRSG